MKKMFFVLCVIMLASLVASAQLVAPVTYDRTFYGYCNGEHMVLQKLSTSGVGSTKVYVAGYEDLTSVCGYPYNAPIVGQKHAIGVKVPPRELTAPTNGIYLDIASAATDLIVGGFSGIQEEWIMDVKNNVVAGYAAVLGSDADYLFTEGLLVNGLPAAKTNLASTTGRPVLGGGKMLLSRVKKH